jgi:hypothetical protein
MENLGLTPGLRTEADGLPANVAGASALKAAKLAPNARNSASQRFQNIHQRKPPARDVISVAQERLPVTVVEQPEA